MTAPDLSFYRAAAAAGRPVSLTALSRAIRADRVKQSPAMADLIAAIASAPPPVRYGASFDPLDSEQSPALADLADIARLQGAADADGPDHDADPWG